MFHYYLILITIPRVNVSFKGILYIMVTSNFQIPVRMIIIKKNKNILMPTWQLLQPIAYVTSLVCYLHDDFNSLVRTIIGQISYSNAITFSRGKWSINIITIYI